MTFGLRATEILALSLVCHSAMAHPLNPHDGSKGPCDLIVRSEITIARPVREIWPYFLDMDAWMVGIHFRNIKGQRGKEGEVRLVVPSGKTPYHSYFIRTVRVTPFEQYVVRVAPQLGHEYFGFADFSFMESDGKTHMVYNIYIESRLPSVQGPKSRQLCEAQDQGARRDVARNNENLKVLVEATSRNSTGSR